PNSIDTSLNKLEHWLPNTASLSPTDQCCISPSQHPPNKSPCTKSKAQL
ncbi:12138_t:CDS:1, partial [Dentiscutata heterogama]